MRHSQRVERHSFPFKGGRWGWGCKLLAVPMLENPTPTLALMELPANRLSPQVGKSLVVPLQGEGFLHRVTMAK